MRHNPRHCLLTVFALLLVVAELGCGEPRGPKPAVEPSRKTCQLVIDFGDGRKKDFPKLAWREGITVIEVMKLAAETDQGLEFSTLGDATGSAAFVDRIDGVVRGGQGNEAKDWTYKINGELAQESAGTQTLNAGDRVVWKFGADGLE